MRHSGVMQRLVGFGVCAALLFCCGTVAAQDEGPVTTVLTAFKVVPRPDGKEQWVEATEAKPDEVIEYRLVVTNRGDQPVSALRPLLPIPEGLVYQAGSAVPDKVQASVDGRTFQDVPLMRRVTNRDGTVRTERVPEAEYRQLRWDMDRLQGGTSVVLKARALVSR